MPLAEVCEAVYAELRAHPTVLVVEDLHWVDAASVDSFVARYGREPMPVDGIDAGSVTGREHCGPMQT